MGVRGAPALVAGARANGRGTLRYGSRHDAAKPHIVKFSGGRSSAMMLFTLIENRLLDAGRGDLVVFNNTAAEHPATYRFVRRCFEAARAEDIPCLVSEFQTYEGPHRGAWARLPAYRLASAHPKWEGNAQGLHWRGEVFEEMVSWGGFLPNAFRRSCTAQLKIATTRRVLADWLAGKSGPERLGHDHDHPQIDPDAMHARHLAHGGRVPKEIYLAKRAYAWRRPHVREAQRFESLCGTRPRHRAREGAREARFGAGGIEYVSLVGVRADEPERVGRIKARRTVADGALAGERVYCPLAELGIEADDVGAFWKSQTFDLELEPRTKRSNCVYCFMKGWGALTQVRHAMDGDGLHDGEFGSLADTPNDLRWWRRMRATYERDYEAQGEATTVEGTTIGWFGTRACQYEKLAGADRAEDGDTGFQPCECTD